jgi:hypothetical protein
MTNNIGNNQHKEQVIEEIARDLSTRVSEQLDENNHYADKNDRPSKLGNLLIDINNALLEMDLFFKKGGRW